jgi:pimeloyl-ACP methyl ester carboxylesterase
MSDEERASFDGLKAYRAAGYSGYFVALTSRPQAVGYGIADSPAGLAGLFLWHPGFGEWAFGDDPKDAKTKDEVLDDITVYWLTNTATSAGRLYWENHGANPTSATAMMSAEISVPVGVTVFPEDVYAPPRSWAERAYPNLVYFNAVDRGGHFAAWEQPELFSQELRAAFRSVR